MIKVKTAENALTNYGDMYIKTSPNALTKIAEGYQVVSVNGEKRLIPVFLSECKHDDIIIKQVAGDCSTEGYVTYKCTKCEREYTEFTGYDPTAHTLDYTSHQAAGYHEWYCTACGEFGTEDCYDIGNYRCVCGTDLSMRHSEGADMCYDYSYSPSIGGTHTVYCECEKELRTEPCDSDVEKDGRTYCSKCGQETV